MGNRDRERDTREGERVIEKKTREESNSDTHVERKRVRQTERHRVGNRDKERETPHMESE